MQTYHMLKAQPSTYDMFALIELFGRKVQSDFMGGRGGLQKYDN